MIKLLIVVETDVLPMHIVLNAHLLSNRAGYRTAGIYGYIYHTLANLPAFAPDHWRFTAFVGAENTHTFDGMTMQHAPVDTEAPTRRILWEQMMQPFAIRDADLYHALAFVGPVWPAGPPTVVTVYDLSFVHFPGVLSTARRAYLRTFTAHTCRAAKRIIAISESTARDVTDTFGIDPACIDVAPPGTNFDVYKPLPEDEIAAFKARLNLPETFWLFIGTLEPRKNLPRLLKAYAALKDRPPLVLGGGKGWDYAEIFETIDRYKLDVRTPGFIPSEDLPLWYNSAALFVYPSIYEGFGIPVLEAMACGTPVIVSNASSLPEVVGDAGLTVPPDDLGAWTDALRTARDDSMWRARARQAGVWAAKRYTWERTALQTVESYRLALTE